jgi:hypothetical protein
MMQMIFVTEVVVGSLHNVLTHFEGVPGASTEARAVRACVQTCTVCVNVCECMCACVCVS